VVTGVAALHRKLQSIPPKLTEALHDELEKFAIEVVATMKLLVPVDNGDLFDSIGYTFGDVPKGGIKIGTVGNKKSTGIFVTIYVTKFYAPFVEFGTQPHSVARNASVARGKRQDEGALHPGAKAQPFFYPGYRANKSKLKPRLARRLAREIKALSAT